MSETKNVPITKARQINKAIATKYEDDDCGLLEHFYESESNRIDCEQEVRKMLGKVYLSCGE